MKKSILIISIMLISMLAIFSGCKPEDIKTVIEDTKPTVITKAVTDISPISAVCGGEITNDNNAIIIASGVVYTSDTEKDPELPPLSSVTSFKLDSLMTLGMIALADTATLNYNASLKVLPNKMYKVRAFVISVSGVSYGEIKNFNSTQFGDGTNAATVVTGTVQNISANSAVGSGSIIAANGTIITKGVCWSLSSGLQSIDSLSLFSIAAKNSPDNNFMSNIKGLISGGTYFVKAFAVNESGVAYGEEVEFTTTSSK